jgi:hypothetical protein
MKPFALIQAWEMWERRLRVVAFSSLGSYFENPQKNYIIYISYIHMINILLFAILFIVK